MGDRGNGRRCDDYITFGTCRFGPKECKNQHGGDIWESKYFFAVVKKVNGKRMHVLELGSVSDLQAYWVGGSWASNDAKPQDMVVFQRSEREKNGDNYGRVVLVVGSDASMDRVQKSVELAHEIEAFVLRPDDGDKEHYSALSVKSCKAHGEGCKEIGVHISCEAWDLHDRMIDIPANGRLQHTAVSEVLGRDNKNLTKFGPFQLNRKYLAISVFVHSSAPENTSEPKLTPVRISRVCSYSEISTAEELNILWSVFQADATNKMLRGKNHWYFTHEANAYKAYIVRDEALFSATLSITKYFRESDLDAVVFFKPTVPSTQEICALAEGKNRGENYYLILGEHLERAKIDAEKSNIKAMRGIVASIKILTFPDTLEEISGISKFSRGVRHGKNIVDYELVDIYPSRIGGVANQQILLGAMLGSTGLYGRNDLLGITVRRFPQPTLVKSMIRKLDDESVQLNHIDLFQCDHVLFKIPFGKGGLNGEVKKFGEKSVLRWANFKCDGIEFDKVFSVERKGLTRCLQVLQGNGDGMEALSQISHCVQPPPYQLSEDGTLNLDLTPRLVIRLQICNFSPSHPKQIGHRILRVGRNGHICLSHLNQPEITFTSDRHDLRCFVSQKRLEDVKRSLSNNELNPTEREVTISWSGCYNAGGKFKTKENLRKGDFLCIRKDMYDGERVTYVWNAHAVVTDDKGEDSEVTFATCTLLQPGETYEGSGFVIEYIKMSSQEIG